MAPGPESRTPAHGLDAVQSPVAKALEARPRDPAVAYLLELAGAHPGAHHRLATRTRIGRGTDADLRLDGSDVSREHAEIQRDGEGAYHVRDLDSRHGLRVNGVPTKGQPLAAGDRLGIGDTVFLFTLRDEVEERLQHEQRMASLGRLAGGIAHDFNNLLASALTNLDYLGTLPAETPVRADAVGETLEDCRLALERAAELTRDLLGFARRGKYAHEPIELDGLVSTVLRLVRDRGLEELIVYARVDPELFVRGDPGQLHQVLMNICFNAKDAMLGRGQITVRGRLATAEDRAAVGLPPTDEPQVLVSVEDDGPGMDEQTRRQAFEPFFTTKPVGKGTGLGLASVYGIVVHHGGSVHLESEVGVGTTVKVFLPASQSPPQRAGHSTDATPVAPEAATVLVVDDDALVRASTARYLSHFAYRVEEASDGEAALRLARARRPDVVLLDLRMPGLGGPETFEALRNLYPDLPIILVTGDADEARAEGLLQAGAVGLVRKPFDPAELGRLMHRATNP